MIDLATEITRREWNHLRNHLRKCGDIGEFNPDESMESEWIADQGYEGFISNVTEMEGKLSENGYRTPEALNALSTIAAAASDKLGLNRELSSSFGTGYAFVRTGLLISKETYPHQILFHKLFFPLGGMRGMWDFYLNSNTEVIQNKLKIVFDTFKEWQNDPSHFERDFAIFSNPEENWKAWNEVWTE